MEIGGGGGIIIITDFYFLEHKGVHKPVHLVQVFKTLKATGFFNFA